MPISLYPICWRNRQDCEPIQCIDSAPAETSEDHIYLLDYVPTSFVCSGCIKKSSRIIGQDIYRLCFKNSESDEMSDNDMQDLSSILVVVSSAISFDSIRKRNNGIVEIPDHDE